MRQLAPNSCRPAARFPKSAQASGVPPAKLASHPHLGSQRTQSSMRWGQFGAEDRVVNASYWQLVIEASSLSAFDTRSIRSRFRRSAVVPTDFLWPKRARSRRVKFEMRFAPTPRCGRWFSSRSSTMFATPSSERYARLALDDRAMHPNRFSATPTAPRPSPVNRGNSPGGFAYALGARASRGRP